MLQLLVSTQLFLARLRDEDRGATAVEYGLMVSLIAVIIIGVVTTLGLNLKTTFTTVGNAIK